MNREFFVNIVFLIVANLLVKPAYLLVIEPAVQNRVGSEAYGMYFVLWNFAVLLQIINDFGIQNFISRELAQNRHQLDSYFSSIFSLKIVLTALFFIVTAALGLWKYGMAWLPMLLSVALTIFLFITTAYLRAFLAGLGLYRLNSILSVLDKFLLLGLCSVLLWVEPFSKNFTIETFIHAQNFTAGLTALVAFIAVFRKTQRFNISFDLSALTNLLKKALPYALVIFVMTIYTRTDAVMLEWLLPKDGIYQANVYAQGYRFLDAVNVIGLLFVNLLMPMLSRQLQQKIDTQPLIRFGLQLLLVGALTVTAAIGVFRYDITAQLYREATPYWGDVLAMLMVSFVAASASYIYSTLIGAAGLVSSMNRIFISAFALNISLNLWLIPTQKAFGAAISTTITEFFVLIGLIFLAKKLQLLRGGIGWSFKLWAYGILVFGLMFFIKNTAFEAFWWVKMGMGVVVSLVIALAMGFLDYRKMEGLLSEKGS
jgi:O-antigen/teichoic acid export membrane protein